jgi:hypothetical protein
MVALPAVPVLEPAEAAPGPGAVLTQAKEAALTQAVVLDLAVAAPAPAVDPPAMVEQAADPEIRRSQMVPPRQARLAVEEGEAASLSAGLALPMSWGPAPKNLGRTVVPPF